MTILCQNMALLLQLGEYDSVQVTHHFSWMSVYNGRRKAILCDHLWKKNAKLIVSQVICHLPGSCIYIFWLKIRLNNKIQFYSFPSSLIFRLCFIFNCLELASNSSTFPFRPTIGTFYFQLLCMNSSTGFLLCVIHSSLRGI